MITAIQRQEIQKNLLELGGKNWGTQVTEQARRIDVKGDYKTSKGQRVIDLQCILCNSTGSEVTFPIKGSVVIKEKPLRTEYTIWTLDGRNQVIGTHDYDLREV